MQANQEQDEQSSSLPAIAQQKPLDKPKKNGKRITPKVAELIRIMVEDGLRYTEAATPAGLSVRKARQALEKPHVLAELKRRKEVFRAQICGGNILRLAQIRDAANNMPAVNAIKELERLGETDTNRPSNAAVSPGFVIIVQQHGAELSAHQRQIEAKPLIQHDTVSHSVPLHIGPTGDDGGADD